MPDPSTGAQAGKATLRSSAPLSRNDDMLRLSSPANMFQATKPGEEVQRVAAALAVAQRRGRARNTTEKTTANTARLASGWISDQVQPTALVR